LGIVIDEEELLKMLQGDESDDEATAVDQWVCIL
jgi:hypothetical protein